jgi:cell division protein FtsB
VSTKSALNLGLLVLLLLLQWPLWLGKGSWWEVRKLQSQLDAQQAENAAKRERNARLASDVKDLKEGYGAAESQARKELGMIKPDEVFIQITPAATRATPAASAH